MIWHPVIVFFVLGVIASFAAFCGYCAGELDRLSRERGEGERALSEIGAWGDPGQVLGTVESMSTGVVAVSGSLTTVQCSVCLRTYTDGTFWAVKEMNFAPDDEGLRRGWTKYRRCRSCREAGKHPHK